MSPNPGKLVHVRLQGWLIEKIRMKSELTGDSISSIIRQTLTNAFGGDLNGK